LAVVNSNGLTTDTTKDTLDQKSKDNENAEQWDDEAMVANTFRKNVVVFGNTPSTSSGLLDMKSFDPKGTDPDNIAEKLRVEETKAQLAAAREGMEREAAKLKEERERKDQAKIEAEKARTATSIGGSSRRWVAPHLRANAASSITRPRMGGSVQKLDVQDEELFPDLASADKILEKKEREKGPVMKAAKKTPVGGGATWASKPVTTASQDKVVSNAPVELAVTAEATLASSEPAPVPVETTMTPSSTMAPSEPIPEIATVEEVTTTQDIAPAGETGTNTQQPIVKKTVTKKKKKDLSTFKPGA
jgi:hypothetical protein